MKWGYVSYHFLYCYINYCILCNEKAEEKKNGKKRSQTMATLSLIRVLNIFNLNNKSNSDIWSSNVRYRTVTFVISTNTPRMGMYEQL